MCNAAGKRTLEREKKKKKKGRRDILLLKYAQRALWAEQATLKNVTVPFLALALEQVIISAFQILFKKKKRKKMYLSVMRKA